MTEGEGAHRGPTVRAVAQLAGVSATTVSLALRGDPSIPVETRQRVLEAARQLDYVHVTRNRKGADRRLLKLAFVIPDYGDRPVTANPFYGELLNGAAQACEGCNASVSLAVLQHNHESTAPLPNTLKGSVDGIVLASPYPQPLVERVAREANVPVVLLDNIFPCSPFDSVMANDFDGGYQATGHLLSLGHRYIITLTGRAGNVGIAPSFGDRYRGYCAACLDAGLTPLPELEILQPLGPAMDGDGATLQGWLRMVLARSPRPTALFCVADFFAIMTMPVLLAMGFRIPGDVSVVGFDDVPIAGLANPALTTIQSDRKTMSRLAVERLLARIAGEGGPSLAVKVGTRLVARGSAGRV